MALLNDSLTDQPLVSVIIPTYNRPQFLRTALESALHQTYSNLEIIVSDNASVDDIASIVYGYHDPRVRLRRNETNVGQLRNVLEPVAEACGKYISFLHDDDAWEPTFLQELVGQLERHTDASIAFSDHYIMDEIGVVDPILTELISKKTKRFFLKEGLHKPFYRIALVDLCIPSVVAAVIRKSAITWQDFPPQVGTTHDIWLAYLACRDGSGAYYCPEKLTRYRLHQGSETNTGRIGNVRCLLFCYNRFLSDPRLSSLRTELLSFAVRAHAGLGAALLRSGQITEARRHLRSGIRHRFRTRTAAALLLTFAPRLSTCNIMMRVLRRI